MPRHNQPRRGSLQFWPRTRAKKILPSANWDALEKQRKKPGVLGLIAYKAGMKSAIVKDNTEHSLTKGKRIIIPVTILEVPPLKIFSVRFYKHHLPIKEIIVSTDKELKKRLKVPKQTKKFEDVLGNIKDYDDIHILVYSIVNKTGIKKAPDLAEVALGGTKEEKLETAKKFINKEISLSDLIGFFENKLMDVHGVTKGHGTQGPVKRFGIKLRFHKTEKGQRKVGSIGPWHPARVTFRVPMAGQMGFFTRLTYNNGIIASGKISEKNINPEGGFKHFGEIKTDFLILNGSVPGPQKRQLLLTTTLRPTKKQTKKNYEFLELR